MFASINIDWCVYLMRKQRKCTKLWLHFTYYVLCVHSSETDILRTQKATFPITIDERRSLITNICLAQLDMRIHTNMFYSQKWRFCSSHDCEEEEGGGGGKNHFFLLVLVWIFPQHFRPICLWLRPTSLDEAASCESVLREIVAAKIY